MESRHVEAAFAALAAFVVATLMLWVYPGYLSTSPECPIHVTAGSRTYCAESAAVAWVPAGPGGRLVSCSSGFVFQGVRFSLYLSYDGTPGDVAFLQGWVSTSTSSCLQVGVAGNPLGPLSVHWTSPDASVYLRWTAPFVYSVGTAWFANVTCGVYLGP